MSIEHAGRAPDSNGPIDPIDVGCGPIVVVTAIALSRSARETLADRLGPGHVVVDIRDADTEADIGLIPAVSGQLVGGLRRIFPDAQILITEFTDAAFGAEFAWPCCSQHRERCGWLFYCAHNGQASCGDSSRQQTQITRRRAHRRPG